MAVFSAPDYISDDEGTPDQQTQSTPALFAPDSTSDDVETQHTELTEPTLHVAPPEVNPWGYLIPFSSLLHRIEFKQTNLSYTLGRNGTRNDIILPGLRISGSHCSISWNGKDDLQSEVTVLDNSSNGTFINGNKISKGYPTLLHQNDMVAFGSEDPQPSGPGCPLIDCRFIYRHEGGIPPISGLYAEYHVLNQLGKGSFATVFKARHRLTSELYAAKIINTKCHLAMKRQMVMFQREIEISMSLRHANIVSLKEVFEDESSIVLVMELLRGGNLLDYVIARQGLSERETRYITKQICEAINYMHGNNIAHRDVKPENILLTDTLPVIVKIADFGLAKAFDNVTFLKTLCGTPNYLAPEVIENSHQYDNLVDSWSIGVTTFFMLTNGSPFIQIQNQDILTYIRTRNVQWHMLKQMRVSPSCSNFVEQLLMKNPERRMSLSGALHHPWFSRSV